MKINLYNAAIFFACIAIAAIALWRFYVYWKKNNKPKYFNRFLGSKSFDKVSKTKESEEEAVQKAIQNFRMSGLNHMFSEEELELIHYD
ncbi:hypothetical protein D7035_08515, partial [Aquimarina sp. AD1]